MRIIKLDIDSILPLLNTALSSFAMWVNVARKDFPSEVVVKPKTQVVGVKFIYETTNKPQVKKATPNVTMYFCQDVIAGFDLPVRGFHHELRNLLVWLKTEQKNINILSTRDNYRLICAILHLKANELFIPPQ